MSLKKLLISAGAMKAGTSYLYKMLERHPGIETTPVKEIHYFAHVHTPLRLLDDSARMHNLKAYAHHLNPRGDVLAAKRNTEFFARYLSPQVDDAWYESLFVSGDDTFKADFSNMASVLPDDGLRHMREIADELRVLYLIRDPMERLWSHVKFHAAVNKESSRLDAFGRDDFAAYFDASGAAAHGRYAENLTRMRRHISADSLKVIYFEDMVASSQAELDDIFGFLGLAPIRFDERELQVIHNPGPKGQMPPAFVEAARVLLAPEHARLDEAGVDVHPRWQRIE